MAIERQGPQDLIETTTTQDAEEDSQIIDVIEALQDDEIQMQEDGSALLGPEEMEMPEMGFSENLAEVVSDKELTRIYLELVSGIENDKSRRKDWEKTYTQGLDLLGFKYDMRTEPFQGASGATHPVLAEAVTQFQALAYKELLPANGPIRTQVIGAPNPEKTQQA